jgi:hypothetical protein
MHKKALNLLAALVALTALAAMPAIASASPVLENDAPEVVPVGSHITGFSSNLKAANGTKAFECSENHILGELTVNAGGVVEGDIVEELTGTKTAFTGTESGNGKTNLCRTSGLGSGVVLEVTLEELPWCLKTINGTAHEWTLDGGTCGTTPRKPIAFVWHFYTGTTLIGSCTYEAPEVTGTYTTGDTTPTQHLHITARSFSKKSGLLVCPATLTLTGDFTFYQETAGMTLTPAMIS